MNFIEQISDDILCEDISSRRRSFWHSKCQPWLIYHKICGFCSIWVLQKISDKVDINQEQSFYIDFHLSNQLFFSHLALALAERVCSLPWRIWSRDWRRRQLLMFIRQSENSDSKGLQWCRQGYVSLMGVFLQAALFYM